MKQIKTILLSQLAVIAILLCISAPAWANLAANTQILNSATLTYWDGSKTQSPTASVTVTVSLVCAAPTLTPGSPQTTSYAGAGTTRTDSFTITATSNGPDTYNLSAAVSASTNTGVPTAPTAVPVLATVQLGATVTTGITSTTSVIVVPSDGVADAIPNLNGIVVGDTVVIGTDQRDVVAISDNASGTSTITLNFPLSVAPGTGVVVGERKTVTITVTAGSIIVSGTDVTVSATMTATSCSGTGAAITSGAVLNTYTSGNADLKKYVRNVTTSAAGTLPAFGYGSPSNNYYLGGVTAKPGDVLEYLLIATNTTPAGTVSSAVITDALPTTYVTFKLGVYAGATDITYIDDAGNAHYLTWTSDADNGVYVDPTLTVNVGGATPAAPPAAGGSIPGTKSVAVLYRVTLIP